MYVSKHVMFSHEIWHEIFKIITSFLHCKSSINEISSNNNKTTTVDEKIISVEDKKMDVLISKQLHKSVDYE